MRFSKPVLILSTVGLGLTLAYSQQSNSDVQQRALEILRQQMAGKTNATPAGSPAAVPAATAAPTRDQLLADIERLHNDGKISDQQYATFKKNINDQYAASAANSPNQTLTQAALAQKIQQLKTDASAPTPAPAPAPAPAPVPAAVPITQAQPKPQPAPAAAAATPSSTEAQAKAQKALDEQLAQQRASQAAKAAAAQPKPQPAPAAATAKAPKATSPKPATAAATTAVAAAAPVAATQAPRTPERTNVIPATAYSALSPQQEAQAREALRQKIAESNSQTVSTKPAPIAAAAAQPVKQPAPAKATAPPVAPPPQSPVPAAPAAAPAQNTEVQGKALAVLSEYEIGIVPDDPPLIRIERLKIAELNGWITPEEAAKVPVAKRFYGPNPWAFAATSPRTEVPFPTSNKEALAHLSELNSLYRSNQISPADYHRERAKIVASF